MILEIRILLITIETDDINQLKNVEVGQMILFIKILMMELLLVLVNSKDTAFLNQYFFDKSCF